MVKIFCRSIAREPISADAGDDGGAGVRSTDAPPLELGSCVLHQHRRNDQVDAACVQVRVWSFVAKWMRNSILVLWSVLPAGGAGYGAACDYHGRVNAGMGEHDLQVGTESKRMKPRCTAACRLGEGDLPPSAGTWAPNGVWFALTPSVESLQRYLAGTFYGNCVFT